MTSHRVIETNVYLRDPKALARMILQSAKSSSAVEGITAPFDGREPKPLARAQRKSIRFSRR